MGRWEEELPELRPEEEVRVFQMKGGRRPGSRGLQEPRLGSLFGEWRGDSVGVDDGGRWFCRRRWGGKQGRS